MTATEVKFRLASTMSNALRRLLASATISSVGDGLVIVALGLLALDVTTDARLIAAVFAAERLPWLLAQRVAAVADAHPAPARLLIRADLLRAGILVAGAVAVAIDAVTIPLLAALAAGLGIGTMIHGSARHRVLADLATGEQLAKANGYLGAGEGLGYAAVGPAVGGAVYELGRAVPLVGDAVSFVASAALMRPLARDQAPAAPPPAAPTAPVETVGALRSVLQHRLLSLLLLQIMVLGFAQSLVLAVTPIFLRDRLDLGGGAYGLFLGLAACGGLVTGLLTPHLWAHRGSGAAYLSGAAITGGACYLAMAGQRNVAVAFVLLLVFDGTVGVVSTVLPTLRIEHSPSDRRSRIGALFSQAVLAGQPVGAVAAGFLTERFGVATTYSTAGALILAVSIPLLLPMGRAVRAAAI